MYNGVLRIRLPNGAQIVGFADDIALMIRGKHLVGLKLADHKTDVLLISIRKKMEFITITVGD